jgi:hypothetical protein
MGRRDRFVAGPAAIGLVLALALTAFAYGPQVPTTITVTPSSGTFLCGHPEAVTATVLDQDGKPIKGVTVHWSFKTSPSSADRILQATSKTNTSGVARTNVKLACVAGDRVISATAGGISGTAVVHVNLDRPGKPKGAVLGATSVRLPDTSSVIQDASPIAPAPLLAIGLAVLGAVAIVAPLTFRRRRRTE